MKRTHSLVMNGLRMDVLRHFVAGGSLNGLDKSKADVRSAILALKKRGLIDFVPTDKGRTVLIDWDAEEPVRAERRARDLKRLAACEHASDVVIQPGRKLDCEKHPLATTDEQIAEVERQALEARRLGF